MYENIASLPIKLAIPAPLDPDFRPAALVGRALGTMIEKEGGGVPLRIGLERSDESSSVFETRIFSPQSRHFTLNYSYVERLVKFLIWQRGGYKVNVGGPSEVGNFIRSCYARGGIREFDSEFMGNVFESDFTVATCAAEMVPDARENSLSLGRHLSGCRVGFDLGASDRKASAVQDGKVVFSEEVPWDPKPQTDPEYHYRGILDSIKRAAAHLPRLDAVGGSTAGIVINNRIRVASLYRGVDKDHFEKKIAGLFIRIQEELQVPVEVVNDGEVTALAGSMSLDDNPVLGIAMGSSEAAGYVNRAGKITGWLNELAFAPVDYQQAAPVDEWSGDVGCGVQYFSQVAAIRLALSAGINFKSASIPEKLVELQELMKTGDPRVVQVYETIGVYLGYTIAHYAQFYDLKHVLVLGRVTTGAGGDLLIERAQAVLKADFPEYAGRIHLALPDEKSRRVGQSIAAASLPKIQKGSAS